MSILDSIREPADIKEFSLEELTILASEMRVKIIDVTSKNGGHIGPNLGVVELTIALHKVFDSPRDRLVFDVAHQGYGHKLLTGRGGKKFAAIRRSGGLSGFLTPTESPHDCYGAGHAGTALSAALGMAVARDKRGSSEHIVAVIGDGSLTCGITMEALNNVAANTNKLIVVLNDNEWSISKNVGAVAKYLNELITNPLYNRLDHDVKAFLKKLPGGDTVIQKVKKAKKETKDFLVPSSLFETYGLRYIGPIDGHDIDELMQYLEFAKQSEVPILLHLFTEKGKGYEIAIKNPEKFHGCSPFDITTGLAKPKKSGSPPNYQDVFGRTLARFAKADPMVVGITAAMPPGTGLNILAEEVPGQFFDVGIAEEHAVIFACGMAVNGLKPVCAIYSTFLQRAYDPIIHDVCLQDLPIVFCLDRAGLSPNDGPTHHGLFDIAYLRCVPNAILMQPRNEDELADMLWTGLHTPHPTFIRYPRGAATGAAIKDEPVSLEIGKAESLMEGEDIMLWALGPWVDEALSLAKQLRDREGIDAGVVNARFAKPLDRDLLIEQARNCRLLVTIEDHVISGGFGSAVLEALQEAGLSVPMERIGWPDRYIDHGSSVEDLRAANGLSIDALYQRILGSFSQSMVPPTSPSPQSRDRQSRDRQIRDPEIAGLHEAEEALLK